VKDYVLTLFYIQPSINNILRLPKSAVPFFFDWLFIVIYASEKKLKWSISFHSFYGRSLMFEKITVYGQLSQKAKEWNASFFSKLLHLKSTPRQEKLGKNNDNNGVGQLYCSIERSQRFLFCWFPLLLKGILLKVAKWNLSLNVNKKHKHCAS